MDRMTDDELATAVLRIVHDRQKLHAHETQLGYSSLEIMDGQAWSYRQILEWVEAYDKEKQASNELAP